MRFLLLSSLVLIACGGSTESTTTPAAVDTPRPAPPTQQRAAPTSSRNTWCTQNGAHDFCADFDGEDALGDWDDALRGSVRKANDVDELAPSERSSPNALHVFGSSLESDPGGSSGLYEWAGMFLSKKLPTTTKTKAKLAFDLYVDAAHDPVGVVELSGRTATNDIAFHVWLHVSDTSTSLSAALGEIPPLPAIEFGRWVRVELAIDDNFGSGGVVHLAFDGVDAGTATFEGALANAAETKLYLGVSRSAPSEAYDVRYDNVVFDYD